MKKSALYLIAAGLFAIHSCALAAPAQPEKTDKPNIVPVGVAKAGVASMAWFLDTNAHQAIWCDAISKACGRLIIPELPNSPSTYVPVGVEVFGSGTGAWLVDANNNQAIICVHNPIRNDCTRMTYWP